MRRQNARWLAILIWLALTAVAVSAQARVRVVVDRDFVNLRLIPALGAEVLGSANAGTTFFADARSPDGEWLRIDFGGNEAWISIVVVTVLEGDVQALPVRDPSFIPFGGNEAPRAGFVDENRESGIVGRLPTTGVRIRSGPSRGYRVLADAPRLTAFPLFGRTASSEWVQVNYEGVLGWVNAQYVEVLGDSTLTDLPVGGIVAASPPLESTDENDLFGTLRFMRERIDLAQPSLDNQRTIWTNAALGVTPPCGGYPPRPSDVSIPIDLRQRYAGTLEPIIRDFNKAMLNVRNAIDLQIEVCQAPGSNLALISAPVVTGGLGFVDEADVMFASLRRRIDELLPEIGPDQCVFEFAGRVDVLPLFPNQAIVEGAFTADGDRAIGYCFDATPLNIGYLEFVRESSNYEVVLAVAPLENPTNFIATASGAASPVQNSTILSPIQFPFAGRYLLIISAEAPPGEVPEGRWAMVLVDAALGEPTGGLISFDEFGNIVRNIVSVRLPDGTIVGGQVVGDVEAGATVTNVQAVPVNIYEQPNTESAVIGQILPGQTLAAIGTVEGFIQVQLAEGITGFVQDNLVEFNRGAQGGDDGGGTTCPGVFLTCNDLISCAEVQACVDAGSTLLDPNGNGIACDSAEGSPPLGCNVAAPLP